MRFKEGGIVELVVYVSTTRMQL